MDGKEKKRYGQKSRQADWGGKMEVMLLNQFTTEITSVLDFKVPK